MTPTAADIVSIDRVLTAAERVQPLPGTVLRLIAVLGSPDWDVEAIGEIVAHDQALAAQILRAANSALHGGGSRIARVEDAVLRLGPGSVLSFSIGRSVRRPMLAVEEGLWRRSVIASLVVEEALKLGLGGSTRGSDCQSAALLHDFGRLVMAVMPEAEDLLLALEEHEPDSPGALAAEHDLFGLDHAEIGCLLAKSWKLPDTMARYISFHHRPGGGDQGQLLVHLATVMARGLEAGEPKVEALVPGVAESLGIDGTSWKGLAETVHGRLEDVLAMYAV